MARALLGYDLSICGLSELDEHAQRVSHVISILDPDYPDPEEFARYRPHRRTTFRFHDCVESHHMPSAPAYRDVEALIAAGEAHSAPEVEHLLIHCHAGISRSTATAAIFMAQRNPGREDEAFAALDLVRPRAWPNSLIIRYADEILGRGGALIEAMRAHHARIVHTHPELAALIRFHGRAHEVPNVDAIRRGDGAED